MRLPAPRHGTCTLQHGRLWVSHVALGSSWEFIGVCYGTLLLLSDLTPTIGLWQTVFVALFDRYRNLFLILFHGHFVSYLIPLGLRFRCDTDQTRPEAPPRPPVLPIADWIDSRFTCPPVCLCVPPRQQPLYLAALLVLLTGLLKTCVLFDLLLPRTLRTLLQVSGCVCIGRCV
jgi:hypothetical protein